MSGNWYNTIGKGRGVAFAYDAHKKNGKSGTGKGGISSAPAWHSDDGWYQYKPNKFNKHGWTCKGCGMTHNANHSECNRCRDYVPQRRWGGTKKKVAAYNDYGTNNRFSPLRRDQDDFHDDRHGDNGQSGNGEDVGIGDFGDTGNAPLPKPKHVSAVLAWLESKGAATTAVDDIEHLYQEETNFDKNRSKAADPWKLLQSSNDKMRSVQQQLDAADNKITKIQTHLDDAQAWRTSLIDKRSSIRNDIDLAQKNIAELPQSNDPTDKADSGEMRSRLKNYEDNLRMLMTLVMKGIPEDVAGKRLLYDTIFANVLPEDQPSPFKRSGDEPAAEADLDDATGCFQKPTGDSPFVAAADDRQEKGASKGASRTAPYSK